MSQEAGISIPPNVGNSAPLVTPCLAFQIFLQHSSGITDRWGVYRIFGRTGRDLGVPENLDARDTSMAIVALVGTVKIRMFLAMMTPR